MAKFVYNSAKNASTNLTSFNLNYSFYARAFYKENVYPRSKLRSADKLATALHEVMFVDRDKLQQAQDVQKQFHDKYAKSWSYSLSKIVWVNAKQIKTK